jgi:hypothetical protein
VAWTGRCGMPADRAWMALWGATVAGWIACEFISDGVAHYNRETHGTRDPPPTFLNTSPLVLLVAWCAQMAIMLAANQALRLLLVPARMDLN